MALSEDDSREPKRGKSLGEQIRIWAGTLAKIAVVVVPVFAGLHYMINAEIAPVRKQIEAEIAPIKLQIEAEIAPVKLQIEAEIAPVKLQIENVEVRLNKFEKTVEKEIGRVEVKLDKLEGRVDQLDDKLDRFIEAMANFRVEVLTWMARNESSRQSSSSQSDGGHEGHSDASSLPVDGGAPTVPVAGHVGAGGGHGC